jgi:hypothetical protein
MHYIFSAATQALLNSDQLIQVISKTGQLLPLAREPITGRFVEMAIGIGSSSFNPLAIPVQIAMGGLQMYQTHRGFTAVLSGITQIQQTLGVLQATTAIIGVGTVANIAISAASLHQILKLREDVREMRVEIKDGFIDLKKALKDQGSEILNHIDEVAKDIKFEQHRVVLIHAYSQFIAATKLIQSSLACDIPIRDQGLASARHLLEVALADYRNPQLLSETSALGKLRRMECAWAIEQTIIMTYQIQKQSGAVNQRLQSLQANMRQDIVDVSNAVRSQEEIDFLYPEISRICTQDLEIVASWQIQAEWIQNLPASDLKLLESSELSEINLEVTSSLNSLDVPEQKMYDEIKPKSHFDSLRDQLQLMALPELRLKYEREVAEKAQTSGHKALKLEALNQSSDMAIANLYHYLNLQTSNSQNG